LKRSTDEVRQALAKMLIGKFDAKPMIVDGRWDYKLTGSINVAGLLPDAVISQLRWDC
jgi:hypothetical protein